MNTKRSVTLTEHEFYEAMRRYVLEEIGLEMPAEIEKCTMRSTDPDDRTITLEWDEVIKSRRGKES